MKKFAFIGFFAIIALVLIFAPAQSNKFRAHSLSGHFIASALYSSGFFSKLHKTSFSQEQNDNLKPSEKRHKKTRIPEILIQDAMTDSGQVYFISLHFYEFDQTASAFSGSIGFLHRGPPSFNS